MSSYSDNILKFRTEGTIFSILKNLKDIDVEDAIISLYISAEDEISYELMKKFDKLLIYACINPNKFKECLHNELKEIALFIQKNNLYNKFFELCHLVYTSFDKKEMRYSQIFFAYQDLLLQQYAYLSDVGKMIYGVCSNDTLLITDEPYPMLDYPLYKFDLRSKNNLLSKNILQEYRKLGFNISSQQELFWYFTNDQTITNMTFLMAHFIDENSLDVYPDKYWQPTSGISILRSWKDTEFYLSKLKERKFLLPPKGVMGIYKNSGDYSKVFFKEVFSDDKIYLLYKVLNDKDEGFCGFFDTKSQLFYSVFRDTSGENNFHSSVENFILENYYHLTCNVEIDRKRNFALLVVDDISDGNLFYYKEQPVVQYFYEDSTIGLESKKRKPYIKGNHVELDVVDIVISPYIRKLPLGATASEEAIAYAKEMGYSLAPNETFVRPFKRKSYQLKKR